MANNLVATNERLLFDGVRLDTINGLAVVNYDVTQLPQRNIEINKIARRDLSVITSADYASKRITVDFNICAAGRNAAEVIWADVKRILTRANKKLEVKQYNENVTYTCTMNASREVWSGGVLDATVEFIASDPFATAVASALLVNNDLNRPSENILGSTFNLTLLGSAPVLPVITITINSFTGSGAIYVTLNDQTITINETWQNGDVIVIDSVLKRVTRNAAIIDYTGRIPETEPGSAVFNVRDDLNAFNRNIKFSYNKRFI